MKILKELLALAIGWSLNIISLPLAIVYMIHYAARMTKISTINWIITQLDDEENNNLNTKLK